MLLGTLLFNSKEYSINDSKGFIPLEKLGQKEGYYGGRVEKFAKTSSPGIFMCITRDNKAIDLYVVISEDLTASELKALCDRKGIAYKDKATKKELIELL